MKTITLLLLCLATPLAYADFVRCSKFIDAARFGEGYSTIYAYTDTQPPGRGSGPTEGHWIMGSATELRRLAYQIQLDAPKPGKLQEIMRLLVSCETVVAQWADKDPDSVFFRHQLVATRQFINWLYSLGATQ